MTDTVKNIQLLLQTHGKERFPHVIEIKWLFGLPVKNKWLNIEEDKDCYIVWMCSHKNTDMAGDTFCVQFNKETGERWPNNKYSTGVYKTALSLWPVHNVEKANAIEFSVKNKLNDCAELIRRKSK